MEILVYTVAVLGSKWKLKIACVAAFLCFAGGCSEAPPDPERPNIMLVMTDDQGWAQVGFHGNPYIRTPTLDRLAAESTEFTQFYVEPKCAPTRAALLTGVHGYRNGVIDTHLGRTFLDPAAVTLAELLAAEGYKTGIFGKWHLGDNYPLRPSDQGFQEVLVHRGGGIGQPAGPPGNTYWDPVLEHNGESKKYHGYCTKIFTDALIEFVEENRDRPFFGYLATNTPHSPFDVDEEYIAPYREMGLPENTARVYGMITEFDENLERLLAKLDELGLAENTIVIFLTDNGPTQQTYTAGLKGRKASAYDGGTRVPFLIRWPGEFEAGRKIDRIAAHMDVVPTLLEAAGIAAPESKFDGVSLMPLLTGGISPRTGRTARSTCRTTAAMRPRRTATCSPGISAGKSSSRWANTPTRFRKTRSLSYTTCRPTPARRTILPRRIPRLWRKCAAATRNGSATYLPRAVLTRCGSTSERLMKSPRRWRALIGAARASSARCRMASATGRLKSRSRASST